MVSFAFVMHWPLLQGILGIVSANEVRQCVTSSDRKSLVGRYHSRSLMQVNRDTARGLLEEQEDGTSGRNLASAQLQVDKAAPPGRNLSCSWLQIGIDNANRHILSLAVVGLEVVRTQGMEVGLVPLLVLVLVACLVYSFSCVTTSTEETTTRYRNAREEEYWKNHCERVVPSQTFSQPPGRNVSTSHSVPQQGVPQRAGSFVPNPAPQVSLGHDPQRLSSLAHGSGVGFSFTEAAGMQKGVYASPSQSVQSGNPYSEYFSTGIDDATGSYMPSSVSTHQVLPSGHSLQPSHVSVGAFTQSAATPIRRKDLDEEVLDQTNIVGRTRGPIAASSSADMTERNSLAVVLAERQRLVEALGSHQQYESPRGMRSVAHDRKGMELEEVLMARQRIVEGSGVYYSPSKQEHAPATNVGAGELGTRLEQRQRAVEATNSQRDLYQSPRLREAKASAPVNSPGELEKVLAKRRLG